MNKFLKNNLFQQVLFWLLSFTILFRLFTREEDIGWIDIYYTGLFHLPLVFVVYVNYYLVNRFFIQQRKVIFYLLGLVVLLSIAIGFHYFTFNYLADRIFQGYYFVSYYEIREVLEFVISYAIISTLLFLSKNWFDLKEKQLALEKENHQVKLATLKSQINPHFLFNSLNNIYGLTASENKLSKNYLLKLSEALRYMIYGTGEEMVLLEKEIKYLKNYVDLEILRMDSTTDIQIHTRGNFSGYLIAPLILLPLIENCFKHCDRIDPKVNIEISIEKDILHLQVQNNKTNNTSINKGGLGLVNLKNRLTLIYPNKHQLVIDENATNYKSSLQINI